MKVLGRTICGELGALCAALGATLDAAMDPFEWSLQQSFCMPDIING